LFKLDRRKYPAYVGGVPPDYFSRTGRLWNNPVYDWNELKRTGFTWWIDRIVHNLGLFDLVRLDHFRGFVSYWEVPAGEKTARNGRWVNACAKPFFNKLAAKIPGIPIIAENLGVITPDVVKIMKEFKFPGIAILQFAFGKDFPESEHLPVKYSRDTVVYTGTHDNNTTRGWFDNDTKPYEKKNISQYFRQDINPADICSAMIELAMKSAAVLSIIPVQDILCLGPESRMNHPSTVRKNWKWQLSSGEFDRLCSDSCTAPLAEITAKYKR
ncbi:MAG: 4-alpha-glucanotransferase, partial [Actinobacteria bacterium]|nr:4-alpha-glucanotransferase [Actinomycetota bacterium]